MIGGYNVHTATLQLLLLLLGGGGGWGGSLLQDLLYLIIIFERKRDFGSFAEAICITHSLLKFNDILFAYQSLILCASACGLALLPAPCIA